MDRQAFKNDPALNNSMIMSRCAGFRCWLKYLGLQQRFDRECLLHRTAALAGLHPTSRLYEAACRAGSRDR